jgi:hypothetical protein
MLIEVANKRFIETKYVSQVYVAGYDFSSEDETSELYYKYYNKPTIYIYAMIADGKSESVLLEDLGRDVEKDTVDKKLQEWVNKINAGNNGNNIFLA